MPNHNHSNVDPRMRGLSQVDVHKLQAAARAIRDGQPAMAESELDAVLKGHPGHPEALRLKGILRNRQRRHDEAERLLLQALQQRPNDAAILSDHASALFGMGRKREAFEAWRKACKVQPDFPWAWFNLGRNLQQEGDTAAAIEALERTVRLAKGMLPAHILLGDALVHAGRFDDADARYRAALELDPACGDAWRGLSNMKTRALTDADAQALRTALANPSAQPADRIAMGHALGKLLEDRAQFADALAAFEQANSEAAKLARWDRAAYHRLVSRVARASAGLSAGGTEDATRGREVIFVVGMPRSGSTLVEQILASHPEVAGASELTDLNDVLAAETRRRRKPFPQWLGEAGDEDWARLGREYLERTARWRSDRPRHADKMPENWLYSRLLGCMLPGAVVLDVRRDPLETAWSCFKQQFYRLPHFSNDFADIAAYTHDYSHWMDTWRADEPARIVLQRYEALLDDPEGEIRTLLAACGLDFHRDCLDFHRTSRNVRTASAAQVRQPLRHDTARAPGYGALLDPLREALAQPPVMD